MSINNNKKAILNSWKRSYDKNHSPYFANKIELVTGEQPDFINGYDDGEVKEYTSDKSFHRSSDEIEGIMERVEIESLTGQVIPF